MQIYCRAPENVLSVAIYCCVFEARVCLLRGVREADARTDLIVESDDVARRKIEGKSIASRLASHVKDPPTMPHSTPCGHVFCCLHKECTYA